MHCNALWCTPSELSFKTGKFLSNITFTSDGIQEVIQNLGSEKAHGHDRISIRMLKIYEPSIFEPLEIFFKPCLERGIFHWNAKGNVVAVHKNDKQSLANYRPISFLQYVEKQLKVFYKTRCLFFS